MSRAAARTLALQRTPGLNLRSDDSSLPPLPAITWFATRSASCSKESRGLLSCNPADAIGDVLGAGAGASLTFLKSRVCLIGGATLISTSGKPRLWDRRAEHC